MKRIFTLVCLLYSLTGISQTNVTTPTRREYQSFEDIARIPFKSQPTISIEGTPYYSDQYCVANIKVLRGKRYRGLDVKLDLKDNRLIYLLPDGAEWEANVPIESVEFGLCSDKTAPATFRSGYPSIDKNDTRTYYQVLDSGSTQLLKFTKVDYNEKKPFNATATIRTYFAKYMYYAYSADKGMINLSNGNEQALTLAFADKKNDVTKFVNDNHLKLKKEDDLLKLFNFYNQMR